MSRTPSAGASIDELTVDPHPVWARLRMLGEVVWVPELGGWVILTRDAASAVMRDARTFTVDDPRFSTARIVGPSMLSTDGAAHTRHRAPFTEVFRPAMVRSRFEAFLEEETGRLLAELGTGTSGDLRTGLAAPLATAAMAAALGLDRLEVDRVLRWYRAMVLGVDAVSRGQDPPADAVDAMAGIRDHVRRNLNDPNADQRSVLREAAAAGADPDDLAADVAVLLFGGVDTAESMTAIAVHHLLGHPQVRGQVWQHPELVPAAVRESLRLEPAATRVDRYATRDVELHGADIRTGDLVIVSLSAANRDPSVFADPHRFDLRRHNSADHLAFALGPHFCLGIHLTTAQTTAALTGLIAAFPRLRAAVPPDQLPPVEGFIFRKPHHLPARWD